MQYTIILAVITLIVAINIVCAIMVSRIAKLKGYSPAKAVILAVFTGIIAVVYYAGIPEKSEIKPPQSTQPTKEKYDDLKIEPEFLIEEFPENESISFMDNELLSKLKSYCDSLNVDSSKFVCTAREEENQWRCVCGHKNSSSKNICENCTSFKEFAFKITDEEFLQNLEIVSNQPVHKEVKKPIKVKMPSNKKENIIFGMRAAISSLILVILVVLLYKLIG